jgi:hypothetical protein
MTVVKSSPSCPVFATELPLVADTIPLHLLYENLHVSSPLKAAVRTPLATAGTSHAG